MIAIRLNHRKYFTASFTKLLNSKLKIQGVLCLLYCNFNWFRNENSRKKNSVYWRGGFTCVDKTCDIVFIGIIDKPFENNMEITLNWNGSPNHQDRIHRIAKHRCTGLERKNLALKLVANGISNTRNDMIATKG